MGINSVNFLNLQGRMIKNTSNHIQNNQTCHKARNISFGSNLHTLPEFMKFEEALDRNAKISELIDLAKNTIKVYSVSNKFDLLKSSSDLDKYVKNHFKVELQGIEDRLKFDLKTNLKMNETLNIPNTANKIGQLTKLVKIIILKHRIF